MNKSFSHWNTQISEVKVKPSSAGSFYYSRKNYIVTTFTEGINILNQDRNILMVIVYIYIFSVPVLINKIKNGNFKLY